MANISVPIQVNLPDDWLEQIIERLKNDPEAEWVKVVRCKNCIHLGHAYKMPCKNCRRNQMLPDWYEVETERRKDG